MNDKGYKFYMEAKLEPIKETVALRKEVASVVDLPLEHERQPDLSYFSSIFVSTGTNLNDAHFLSSELVMAEGTVVSKAVDIEHEEDQIIGHIYHKAFVDTEGKEVPVDELLKKEVSSIDDEDYHVVIASVIYKSRFPQIAQEIAEGKWKVSMEAYYKDFDIKIGEMILSKDEAKALGMDVFAEESYGKHAEIVKAGKIVAEGKIVRVLRGICFSGVGIVKNPANPPSVVLEATASTDTEDTLVLDMDNLEKSSDNNVTTSNIEEKNEVVTDKTDDTNKEASELQYEDTVGLCVNYHKEVDDSVVKDQDSKVLQQNWCSRYDAVCPTAGDYTDSNCLAKAVASLTEEIVEKELAAIYKKAKINKLTKRLMSLLQKQKK
jgi:hypothetical protein